MDTFQTYNMLAAIPEFLVWFAGGLICLYWSSRKPTTAVLIGLAMLLAGFRRAAVLFAPEISLYLEAFPFNAEERMLTLYLLFSLPNAAAWGAILVAVLRELRTTIRESSPDSL
ncbi:MAG: hypothetical protein P8M30_02045 [Planctomycetaceae bacterium]|jgi:hypothetical protein|nr:hypothetical protein [Planctomycetaceae bacterium]